MKQPLGVILAGGQATRMGGGDKGLLRLGGQSVLDRVIGRLSPQVADLALNANGDAARFARLGCRFCPTVSTVSQAPWRGFWPGWTGRRNGGRIRS